MKRVGRRLFNFAAAASLVLCVAMVALWVGSHFSTDAIYWVHGGRARVLVWPRGMLGYVSTTEPLDRPEPGFHFARTKPVWGFAKLALTHYVEFAGFGCAWESKWSGSGVVSIVHVPFWFAAGITLILPAGVWLRYRTERRRNRWLAENCCGACGYDLRASPGRCPECGSTQANAEARPG